MTVSSVEEMLTTSRAAELAGISHTYLRNMTDRGEIPVEYRGTHRRIRLADIMAWLEKQKKNSTRTVPRTTEMTVPRMLRDGVIRIKQRSRPCAETRRRPGLRLDCG